MIRRVAVAALAFSLTLSGARPALAHGFGPTYDIPIPLWLYLYGAAAAVVLSFLPLVLFSRKERDFRENRAGGKKESTTAAAAP